VTVSRHEYSALLIGAPDVELNLQGGSITLDAGTAPHVEGTITIAIPDGETLADLDPRQNARVRLEMEANFSTTTQERTFDLSLRDREVNHADATVTLTVASDEALLSDYAPLTDDTTPLTYQSSLADVVDYVLDAAVPGASLESGPDPDVTTYATTRNLITDPSLQGDGSTFFSVNCTLDKTDTSWAAHGSRSLNLYSPTSSDSFVYVGGDTGAMRLGMSAGKTYVLSATGRVKNALSGAEDVHARRLTAWYYIPTANVYTPVASDPIPTTVGEATRVSVRFTIPPEATEAFIRVYHGHANGQIQWDAFRLSEYTSISTAARPTRTATSTHGRAPRTHRPASARP
jgi:hypothetical protein